MEKPNTRLHDENNGLDYVLVGDYYFPALILAEDSRPVGRWGRMYKRYLKEHHPTLRFFSVSVNTIIQSHPRAAKFHCELCRFSFCPKL